MRTLLQLVISPNMVATIRQNKLASISTTSTQANGRILSYHSLHILGAVITTLGVLCLSSLSQANTQHTDHHHHAAHHHADNDIPSRLLTEGKPINEDIVVTNHQLSLISQAVVGDLPRPVQLLPRIESGHHANLTPANRKAMKKATYIIWFGTQIESPLASAITQSGKGISLLSMNAFKRLPLRDEKGKPLKNTQDPHIWLDPDNAKAISRALAAIFSIADPEHRLEYRANQKQFAKKLDNSVKEMHTYARALSQTDPKLGYWAYHDAYHYLDDFFAIDFRGSVLQGHDGAIKPQQLMWLQQTHPKTTSACLVAEGHLPKGIRSKLAPVHSTSLLEDMAHYDDYITGWKAMSRKLLDCAAKKTD